MAKVMITSYYDKKNGVGYISTSMTQLSLRLGVHRNTIYNKLSEAGFYEDDTCMIFSIEYQSLIKGLPTYTKDIKIKKTAPIVQSTPLKVQVKSQSMSDAWAEMRKERMGGK